MTLECWLLRSDSQGCPVPRRCRGTGSFPFGEGSQSHPCGGPRRASHGAALRASCATQVTLPSAPASGARRRATCLLAGRQRGVSPCAAHWPPCPRSHPAARPSPARAFRARARSAGAAPNANSPIPGLEQARLSLAPGCAARRGPTLPTATAPSKTTATAIARAQRGALALALDLHPLRRRRDCAGPARRVSARGEAAAAAERPQHEVAGRAIRPVQEEHGSRSRSRAAGHGWPSARPAQARAPAQRALPSGSAFFGSFLCRGP
jgi:hypothetical protein